MGGKRGGGPAVEGQAAGGTAPGFEGEEGLSPGADVDHEDYPLLVDEEQASGAQSLPDGERFLAAVTLAVSTLSGHARMLHVARTNIPGMWVEK
ncbi:hypothetical protein EON65_34260 [archaeon]|nr:MAG: hypothetical protein EON65_34260 [archaeon]